MPFEPDHVLLRRYHDAQDRGDTEAATAAWEQLSVNNWDRINGIAKAFRFSRGGRGLPPDEWGAAASEAYLRLQAMGAHFQKREPGQYYAALYTCVNHTCLDFGRKELRHQRRKAGSVDERFDATSGAGPFDAALSRYDSERRKRSADAVEAELQSRHDIALVHWGIRQIKNSNYREVLELTYIDKVPAGEIAERLGISMDNVYARRSRGMRELEKILRDHRT